MGVGVAVHDRLVRVRNAGRGDEPAARRARRRRRCTRRSSGIARAVPGVLGVHDVLVNRYGGTDIISLHIEVSAAENVMHLHEMSEEIETKVRQAFSPATRSSTWTR
jgi:hypothetical protein